MLTQLKQSLVQARNRMKQYADKNRSERSFEVGDWVYLKLQSFVQTSLRVNKYSKLGPRYFGPFLVLEKVGSVAYKLDSPATSQIHPVFHVSLLKKAYGNNVPVLPLPTGHRFVLQPRAVVDKRVNQNPQSGASEATIMQQAIEKCCDLYKKRSFPHVTAWEVVRNHPKWVPVELVDMRGPTAPKNEEVRKGSKTSDSGNYTTSASDNLPQMNLNDYPLDEPDQPVDDPVEEDTPTRPRRKKSGESSSKGKEAVAESIFRIEEEKMTRYQKAEERKDKIMSVKIEREQAYMGHLKTVERQND
ncbi:uncharacterized protein LOC110866729 [Helianthus annuus]|uniref:uncharacterized protein LOC110866729 n=1 Tax=Helianthus annuus TaxID=4232 RepID=UPI000B8FC3B0|nr:uncharacterized protein LOC110866729 [Helianthus annuus]